MDSPGSNFIEPCKQDCVFGFSSWTEADFTVPYRECSPFLSLGHSDAKEKAILLRTVLSIRWHQWDLAWLLVAPPLQKPRGQFDSLRWCFSEGQMFYNSQPLSNGTQIPLPPCSNHLWATKDRAKPQFFSEDFMAMHPNPVLAPFHISVVGTLFSPTDWGPCKYWPAIWSKHRGILVWGQNVWWCLGLELPQPILLWSHPLLWQAEEWRCHFWACFCLLLEQVSLRWTIPFSKLAVRCFQLHENDRTLDKKVSWEII